MDVDTIIPAMVIDAGGNSVHVGFLTAILLGVAKIAQFFFAPFLQNKEEKKGYLLLGINSRVLSLAALATIFLFSGSLNEETILLLIFVFITVFSISGSFANISFTDILGKSVLPEKRKSFFSIKQAISNTGILISAYLASRVLVMVDYPSNYSALFYIAALSLLIASLGFWNVKEISVNVYKISGLKSFIREIKNEFRTNKKFVHYLLMVNTLGICITLLPFLILYAKDIYNAGNDDVGRFLLFKVIGSVITGIILFYFSRRIRYQSMLYFMACISLFMPVFVHLIPSGSWFFLLFIPGGVIFALQQVVISGVLLEISSNHNRAFYAGLAGAGNLLPALFPIIGGWLIKIWGFPLFFSIFMTIIASSFYFIYRLNCKR
ncbi:MAG: MFS transporter, partial [Bacteroidales bacterium]|nr:MFS transporter [Bacteroidales bacterium]